jgi:hypothetical protein
MISQLGIQSPPDIDSITRHLQFLIANKAFEHEIDQVLDYLNANTELIKDEDSKKLQKLPLFLLNPSFPRVSSN